MKTALSRSITPSEPGSPTGTNCGRNATKNIVSFGLSRLISTPEAITRAADRGSASPSTANASLSRRVAHAMYSR